MILITEMTTWLILVIMMVTCLVIVRIRKPPEPQILNLKLVFT